MASLSNVLAFGFLSAKLLLNVPWGLFLCLLMPMRVQWGPTFRTYRAVLKMQPGVSLSAQNVMRFTGFTHNIMLNLNNEKAAFHNCKYCFFPFLMLNIDVRAEWEVFGCNNLAAFHWSPSFTPILVNYQSPFHKKKERTKTHLWFILGCSN